MAAKIKFELDADVSRAIKNIEGFAASTTGVLQAVGAAAVAAAGFLVGREVVQGLKEIARASAESEKSITSLNVALKLAGDFSEESSQRFQDLASQLQANTTFSDDLILQNVALAKSFNITNDETEKLIRAATDLSAATGQDLTTSVQLLGRSFDGTAGKLNELVPGVRNLTRAELESGAAIEIVAKRFAGAADAAGNTFSGGLIKAENAFDDLQETLGQFITKNPILLEAIKGAAELFRRIAQAVEENKKEIASFINEGIIKLIKLIPSLVSALDILNAAFLGIQKTLNFLDKIGVRIAGTFAALVNLGTDAGKEVVDAVNKDIAAIDQANRDAEKSYDDRSKAIAKIVEITQAVTDATVESAKAQVQASNDASKALKNQTKVIEKLNKAQRELVLSQVSANPIAAAAGQVETPKATSPLDIGIGIGAGIILAIGKGAEGAQKLVTQSLGAAAEAFLPGVGAVVAQVADVLAQGPEKVKEFFGGFIRAIPQVIQAIILSVPTLILTLVNALPNFITALVDSVPVIVEAFILALPQIVDSLISLLPRIVESLVQRVPAVINKLVEKAPEFVNALAADSPRIITELVAGAPRIITQLVAESPRLITSLSSQMPFVATQLAIELIKNIPNIVQQFAVEFLHIPGKFLDALLQGLKSAFGNIPGISGDTNLVGGAIGGAVGGVTGAVVGAFGLAEGGLVPSGYNNDTYPARLTSGELVVDRSTTGQLQDFLYQQRANQGGSNNTDAKLDQIMTLIKSDQGKNLQIVVKVSEKDLAQVLVNLNRQGFRTV